MADKAIRNGIKYPDFLILPQDMPPADWAIPQIRLSHVIDISNVAQYFYEVMDHGLIPGEDVPNIAPPFESMFMEFRRPKTIKQGGVTHKWDSEVDRVGCLVLGSEPEAWAHDVSPSDAKWQLTGLLYFEIRDSVFYILVNTWFAGSDGTPLAVAHNGNASSYGLCNVFETTGAGNITRAVLEDWAEKYSQPFLLAIAFMHCKNVKMVEHDPSLNVYRHKVKRHPLPRMKYHTLEINPMKEVLRKEGDIEHNGLKMALHICRGHFKDYREHGLFGKAKGLYWWDSHVRGSLNEGVVLKDYKINEPKDDKPQRS